MENINNKYIVAYAADGTPLDINRYKAKLDKGMRDHEEGRYLTHDQLLEEMKNW